MQTNPMYKEAGRKIAEGKVNWANLLPSYHYHSELISNRFGMVMVRVQTLNLQGITVVIREFPKPHGMLPPHYTAYWAWEKLIEEGNVG